MSDAPQSALSAVGAQRLGAIGLAPETPFPAIAGARRFVCAACGSRRANVSPDWRGHRAAGMGRCHFAEVCEFRRKPAGDTDLKPARVPI